MAKILVVGKYYPPCRGGTEANTRDVCEALAKQHDVTAWVFNHERGSRTEAQNGVALVRCAVTAVIKSQPVSWRLWRGLSLDGFDLVHFHAPNFFAAAVLLRRLRTTGSRIPVVITHHSDVHARRMLRRLVMPLYHRLARRARWVVVTSMKNARVSADLPEGARIAVVPLGLQIDDYAIDGELRVEAGRWRRATCGDAPTIAFVGRHVRYKGLDVFVRALAAIPGAHGLIVGDGPFRVAAEALAARLGIQARAHFFGEVSEAVKLRTLASADVFAFPSTEVTEAFGIAQLEAMAAGVPVVASDLPTGVTDIAVHDLTALVVPPGDAPALAAALQQLLGNKDLRLRLADQASAHVRQQFAKNNTLQQFCSLINSALDKQHF